MAIHKIVLFSEKPAVLRQKSEPIRVVNRRVKKLVKDLKDTLIANANGIGLAAPQINIHSRVVVVRLGGHRDDDELDPPLALINPEIVEAGRDERDFDGCLSLPGLFAETVRPHYLRVSALDEKGRPFEQTFEGFDAVVVHHEIDHLNGVLFIDRVASVDDLYRVQEDENGQRIRVPVKIGEV